MKTFSEILKNVPNHTRKLVEKQGDIALHISNLLKEKGITQREFANRLKMKESRLSKILSGQVNLTLKTIVNLELALGEDIIKIPVYEHKSLMKTETEIPISNFKVNVHSQSDHPFLPWQDSTRINIDNAERMQNIHSQKSNKQVA